ncbi:MAG: ATP-binding cassette domain-containing protein, partial [Candidatus Eremiobacteraeota bacterium]|nr:ATP-binding cassette domain-containing protein [Candidatus Eremiobacteraeota bacterium]
MVSEALAPASALSLLHTTKRFGETSALSDGTIAVAPGSVHALLGENGAGKTTLMRIAYGLVRADAGEITIDGRPVRLQSPADAIARGVGMVHQHLTAVASMTVAENVALGQRGRYDVRAAHARVLAVGERTGLILDPSLRAGDLPVSAQQRLEIVKALAGGARVLILDEPTAVLAPSAAAELVQTLRVFAGRGGSVVLITHKLREALAVADEVTVLRRGRTVLHARADAVTESALVAAMLGDNVASGAPAMIHRAPRGAPVLVARALVVHDDRGTVRVHDASLDVYAGEIVGIVGVEGAGQHELLRA